MYVIDWINIRFRTFPEIKPMLTVELNGVQTFFLVMDGWMVKLPAFVCGPHSEFISSSSLVLLSGL